MKGSTSCLLGQLHNWKGEYEQALQLLEQGFTIGHAHDLQLIVIWILWHEGPDPWWQGGVCGSVGGAAGCPDAERPVGR